MYIDDMGAVFESRRVLKALRKTRWVEVNRRRENAGRVLRFVLQVKR